MAKPRLRTARMRSPISLPRRRSRYTTSSRARSLGRPSGQSAASSTARRRRPRARRAAVSPRRAPRRSGQRHARRGAVPHRAGRLNAVQSLDLAGEPPRCAEVASIGRHEHPVLRAPPMRGRCRALVDEEQAGDPGTAQMHPPVDLNEATGRALPARRWPRPGAPITRLGDRTRTSGGEPDSSIGRGSRTRSLRGRRSRLRPRVGAAHATRRPDHAIATLDVGDRQEQFDDGVLPDRRRRGDLDPRGNGLRYGMQAERGPVELELDPGVSGRRRVGLGGQPPA